MKKYYLKHRDIIVALFSVSKDGVVDIRYSKSENVQKHLPMGTRNTETIRDWIMKRGIPVTRQGIRKDLDNLNVRNTFLLMLENFGLSLTDNYWVCPVSCELSWGDVNLYDNDFNAKYSLDLNEDIKGLVGKTEFTPSASLKGDLKKKWIILKDGTRVLVKGNYSKSCLQSISEVFASAIHHFQGSFPFVEYKIIEIGSGKEVVKGCMCNNFTNKGIEFIPAIDVVDTYIKPNSMSYYEFYIDICKRYGINVRPILEYQIMTDFIISNSDRHFNNFGVLREADSLQWVSSAPIFDSGNSLFYKSSYIPVDKGLLKLEVTSFLKREVSLLKYVRNRDLVDIGKLPTGDYLYNLLCMDKYLGDNSKERIVRAYERKIAYLEDFQNGANLWEYKYSRK